MNRNTSLWIIAGLLLAAAFTRLIPHWPNFTSVAAVALIGGAWIRNKGLAFLLPLIALFLSDLVLNNVIFPGTSEGYMFFYSGMPWVYGAFALTALLGIYGLKKARWERPLPFLGYAGLSTVLFFLLTNFGAWIGNPLYPQTAGGLMSAMLAGIPYGLNFLGGTVFYGFVLMGARHAISMSAASSRA